MKLNTPLKDQQLMLESITDLDVPLQQNQSQETIGQKCINVNKARDGDYAENFVALAVWERGGEVFKNYGKSGKVDLVLQINDRILLADVKSNAQYRVHNSIPDYGYYQNSLKTIPEEVYMICFHPITKEISWNTNRIPEGLENFWK